MNKKGVLIIIILIALVLVIFFIIFTPKPVSNPYFRIDPVEDKIRMSTEYNDTKLAFENKAFDNAFAIYSELIQNHPEQEWLLIEKGDMYDDINDYENALICYKSIKSPKSLTIGARQVDLRIGGIFEKTNRIDSARFYYNKILAAPSKNTFLLDTDNDRASAYNRLGKLAFNDSSYVDAVNYFSEAIEIERVPEYIYRRANTYFLIGTHKLAKEDYDESIKLVRRIYIDDHPQYKDVLCDTCGPHFGTIEYLAVLEEWRNFDEIIQDKKEFDNLHKSRIEYTTMVDSIPKWHGEAAELRNRKDENSVKRYKAVKDSINKYSDTTMIYNIYE